MTRLPIRVIRVIRVTRGWSHFLFIGGWTPPRLGPDPIAQVDADSWFEIARYFDITQ
jgi:hypothetical protein